MRKSTFKRTYDANIGYIIRMTADGRATFSIHPNVYDVFYERLLNQPNQQYNHLKIKEKQMYFAGTILKRKGGEK